MEGTTRANGRLILVGGILFFAVVTAFCYPSYYSQADSGCYVSMAHVFARGRLSAEGITDLNLYRFVPVDGRLVGLHDAGFGMLLAPFTFIGPRACFALNLLLFLISFVVFHRLLKRLGLHPLFSLLYLLHPTLWYHSRHFASDFASGAFFLFAFSALLSGGRARFLAGVWFGLAVFVRPASVVFVGPFLTVWFLLSLTRPGEGGRRDAWKGLAVLTLGASPILAALLAYNVGILHSWTGFIASRVPAGARSFAIENVPGNLLRYGFVLNLLYPLMLVLFFFYKGPFRWPAFASVIAGGVFYMTYVEWGLRGPVAFGNIESIILGPRYFEVVMPVMLLGYASVLNGLFTRFPRSFPRAFAVALVLLAAGIVAITVVHQRHLDLAAYFRDRLFENTPKGSVVLICAAERNRISADVVHPRLLRQAFPFDEVMSRSEVERLLADHGDAYVPVLTTAETEADARGEADRAAFLKDHPGTIVYEGKRRGWDLRIFRVGRPPAAGQTDDKVPK